MIIHIFENIPHHYHNFIKFFINHCGNEFKHKVLIESSSNTNNDEENVRLLNELGCQAAIYRNHQQLILLMKQEDKNAEFIFHSLLNRRLWLKLLLTNLPKRSSWVSWGADTYQYLINKQDMKQHVARMIHSITCNRMHYVKSLNPGDGKLINQLLGRKQVETLPYPLVGVEKPETLDSKSHKTQTILLGNSAAKSNNHFELLDSIKHLATEDISVLMPLNYAGTQDYIHSVITQGNKLFGNKFQPITEMLSKAEYDNLLAGVDITVFAHDRQQGLYVAYYMMLHGKKLFLKASTSTFENFKSYQFDVHSLENLSQLTYEQLKQTDPVKQVTNQNILLENFTEAALARKWHHFFGKLSQQH
ncbi:TDP-N-acetylfucosamine:lipid II N-acetylfucosaminyltransferase [uncultured Shewanella sp.]|uniref:TDP-N-acetylfucosamine:lipid II N-acetylfucosaminyltransferase n=1 Tax=uncultured Shewanella sp. TaxID=173975 RepID=UPI00262A3BA0|nr:TDP-N-acetylfucosamine:lipid II N-acetylfucosaminyltransferase [uncultured Shewanella sp.]